MTITATVEGLKYQTPMLYMRGSTRERPDVETYIFIPHYNLNISKNGLVFGGTEPLTTVAAHRALQAYKAPFLGINPSPFPPAEVFKAAQKECAEQADKEASSFTPISISRDLANDIKSLYGEHVAGRMTQKDLAGRVASLIGEHDLFTDR